MKQIHSIFLEDDEFDALVKIKEKKNWTWKDMLLSLIGKKGN